MSSTDANDISARIYVGNINFNATEDELKDFFEGFNVVSVEIPSKTLTRRDKSFVKRLGFGFVQFESEAEAEKAIETVSGKKFKSRQIYAKKAMPPLTEEEKKQKAELHLAKKKELAAKKKDEAESKVAVNEAETKVAVTEAAAGQEPEKSKKKSKKEKKDKEPVPTKNGASASKTPEGNKSKDTIFITNLNYKVNGIGLTKLFEDLNPVWTSVPPKRVPTYLLKKLKALKKPIFNKGIAFVKFADEETQLRAINEFNGREFEGRNIIVEAAVDKEVPAGEENDGEATNTDAAPEGEQAEAAEENPEETSKAAA